MLLSGKKAVVTGGSRGIGLAIAKQFIEEGAEVLITGRSMARLEKACDELKGLPVKLLEWDVAKVAVCRENVEKAGEMLNGLDIFVNNAGILTPADNKGFFNISEEVWDQVMNVNLKGVYFCCQAVARYMIDHNIQGRIINIASEMGLRGAAVPYGISKRGVIGMTKGIARHLAPKVIVNGIAPGAITTEMMNWKPGDDIKFHHPLGRMGFPEEVANVAVFLASEKSNNIVGEIIVTDGGSLA